MLGAYIAMGSRLQLQSILEEILNNGSGNPLKVYYQPPESVRLTYPCIIYNMTRIEKDNADDAKYLKDRKYTINYISRTVDDDTVERILVLPFCSHDRRFVSDNLYHDVFTLFY